MKEINKFVGNIELPKTIRTFRMFSNSLLVLLLVFTFPIIFFFLEDSEVKPIVFIGMVLLISVIALIAILVTFFKFYYKIYLDYEGIKYIPLSGKGFELKYSEIESIDIIFKEDEKQKQRMKTLLIFNGASDCFPQRRHYIDIALLNKHQQYIILNIITSYAVDAKSSAMAQEISRGDFLRYNKIMKKHELIIAMGAVIIIAIRLFLDSDLRGHIASFVGVFFAK